jgi:SAM-dependent methyltransferase
MTMIEVTDHHRRYWQYEYDVSHRFMAPLVEGWGLTLKGASVLDVGCAEGGGLCAFHDLGAHCTGFDITPERIAFGEVLRGNRVMECTVGDLHATPPPFAGRTFDLVMLHDVFEHLEEKVKALGILRTYLKPGGRILITFPPYYSAYGAHQQHLHLPVARLPFFHLIPFAASWLVPRLRTESAFMKSEVDRFRREKMGLARFRRIAREAGMIIHHEQAYIISPNHIRFGLRPMPAGPAARIPVLSEIICTGVAYFLGAD